MTAVARLPLVAGVLAFGCGDPRILGGATPPDAAADMMSGPASDAPEVPPVDAAGDMVSTPAFDASELPYIEVDCTPSIALIGRFFPQCHLSEVFFAGADSGTPTVVCDRNVDPQGWVGSIWIFFRRPQEITVGQPMIVGGPDPGVSVQANSGSITATVQSIPDTEAGAIVVDAFEPGRVLRGHFVDVTFGRYPRPPMPACRISNTEFVAQ